MPLTVAVDGRDHLEGVDLSIDDFYARLAAGARVTTAAPSPGQFLAAYQAAIEAGATEILSVHTGSTFSATVNAAALAARMASCPVEIIDTGGVSFPVAACVWAAGVVLERGGTGAEAARAARGVAAVVDSVSLVGAPALARGGGRLADVLDDQGGVPVLGLRAGTMEIVARVEHANEAVDAMITYVRTRARGRRQRVGVGHAAACEIADDLAAGLLELDEVVEVVRYDVGPSVGAHTGPGAAGCVFFPDDCLQ